MRKSIGIQGIQKNEQFKKAYEAKGKELANAKIDHVQRSMEAFRGQLVLFAEKHKDAIQRDPQFRQTFAIMCNQIGVDPLASSKGFWAELLGLGDYYFDLGTKIIAIAISTRDTNGGILGIDEVTLKLNSQLQRNANALAVASKNKKKNAVNLVTEDDVIKAVEKVTSLGTLRITNIGTRKCILSVPIEFNHDQTLVLEFASQTAQKRGLHPDMVSREFGWLEERSKRALMQLGADGLAWIDAASDEYWFPAFANVSFQM